MSSIAGDKLPMILAIMTAIVLQTTGLLQLLTMLTEHSQLSGEKSKPRNEHLSQNREKKRSLFESRSGKG